MKFSRGRCSAAAPAVTLVRLISPLLPFVSTSSPPFPVPASSPPFRPDYGLAVWAGVAAFATYFCMYAFRKPFTAATFEGLVLWGIQYKIVLIVAQVLGYTVSKFVGIKFISELSPGRRIVSLLLLLGFAELALVGFALVPFPYNFGFLFLNGLPLGMVFGIVFSFLEGRRLTELLSVGLSVSIIFASGAVKSVGKLLLDAGHVSPWWMPAVTGLLFVPVLLFSVWMLSRIPPPTADDVAARSVRQPMTGAGRRTLFRRYAPGLVLLIVVYIVLTALRDLRDNFAVEIWTALGYGGQPGILTTSELIISLLILVIIAACSFIRNNARAFWLNHVLIATGGLLLGVSTLLFQLQLLTPLAWMITAGFGLFLGYIIYQSMLFERMIATFREPANAGFLMYLADSFGYLGSVAVLLWRNFGAPQVAWLDFFQLAAYATAGLTVVVSLLSLFYFWKKSKRISAH